MIITYAIGDSLYLNVTNRCTNRCAFCIRDTTGGIGTDLWLEREPTVEEICADIDAQDMKEYREVVFCGYGEPFERTDTCLAVARHIKEKYGVRVRVNTNGHGSRLAGRDITPELAGLFDAVSVSLNQKDAQAYQALCQCAFGEEGFDEMLDFTARCRQYVPEVTMSVVDVISPEDIEACRAIADGLGVQFRVRHMQGEEKA